MRHISSPEDTLYAQSAHMAQSLRLAQVCFVLSQLFFPLFALGDVDHGAHKFREIVGWAEHGMAYHVDISDLATGMNDSVIDLITCPLASRCLDRFPYFGLIIRMNALKEPFVSRLFSEGIKTQNAIAFFGASTSISPLAGIDACTRVAEPLRFRQITLITSP